MAYLHIYMETEIPHFKL